MIHPKSSRARSVSTSLSIAAVAFALAASVLGCEGDSFGYATRKLPAYKNGGGGGTPAQQSNDPGPGNPDPSPAAPPGSSPDSQTTTQDDAGAKVDASKPPPSAPGTCGNPKCAAVGGLCGCKATDGAGNNITMGCQGGACACFDARGNDVRDFDGTCDDPASAAIAFQQCACN